MDIEMVLHKGYGMFSLSDAACKAVWSRLPRHDPDLVRVVRKLGKKAGEKLEIVTVHIDFEITEHAGWEKVKVKGWEVSE